MQFMMLMIPAVYQGGKTVDPEFAPDPAKMEEMGKFNDALGKALKVISVNGLRPLAIGARVEFGNGNPVVTDGPSIEAKEVLGGYWIIEADSKEEIVQWAQRCPAEAGDVIEVRQIWDDADFWDDKPGGDPSEKEAGQTEQRQKDRSGIPPWTLENGAGDA